MEIIGIGTEIVECVRIAQMIGEHGELFLTRVFTPEEIRYCRQRKDATEQFAALWAGKEAALKALGIQSVKGLTWTDLEIRHGAGEQTRVCLAGAIKDHAAGAGVTEIFLSLAQCRAYATAYALAVKA